MLNYPYNIESQITRYLSWNRIPYHSLDKVGIITFSATVGSKSERYEFYVNISNNSFFITVTSPIKVPQNEKVVVRLAKFCCQANQADNSGGFLLLDYQKGLLLYRMRIACSGESSFLIEKRLPHPARMLDYYSQVFPPLIQGKCTILEAMEQLEQVRYSNRAPLAVPRES